MTHEKKQKAGSALKTVGFIAMGCPKNMVDAEAMLARIGMAGFVLTDDADNADIVIINTCGFIAPAKEEALQAIRNALKQNKKGRIRKVVVTGCLSERMGKDLLAEAGDIDAIVGLAGRDSIDTILKELEIPQPTKSAHLCLGPLPTQAPDDRARLRITPSHWAYLRISEGCNRRCSFCTIPAIRGNFRSKPMELILEEAQKLTDSGAVELSLIAQDSNFYGRDMGIKDGLIQLIRQLEKIPSLQWIRLMYLYPAGIDDNLIAAIADSPKVVRYADVPIQHINDDILKTMRRTHTKASTLELIEKLRKAIPDVVLRTTVIAGFPGETESQFQELLDFIRQTEFDALGCFPFYPEPGTPAAELPGQVPQHIRQKRSEKIMLTQQPIAFKKVRNRIRNRLTVLVDENNPEQAVGRFYGQAPHIDSVCLIESRDVKPGTFIETEVIGQDGYDTVVKPVKNKSAH
jgi:ribosomal protein S12 methylthiotransferase